MKEPRPLVSVIVPVYNREATVRRALDSVFEQTWRPLELTVVDDGSSDDSPAVVQDWIEAHRNDPDFTARLIRQQNAGGSAARNRGLDESRGEFVQFLDSDDWLHPDKIRLQAERLLASPEPGFVYGPVGEPDHPTGFLYGHRKMTPRELKIHQIAHPFLTTPGPLMRRTVFEQAGRWDESLRCCQDWELHSRIAMHNMAFDFVPEARVFLGSDTTGSANRVSHFGRAQKDAEKWLNARLYHLDSVWNHASPQDRNDPGIRKALAAQTLHLAAEAEKRGLEPLSPERRKRLRQVSRGTALQTPVSLFFTAERLLRRRASFAILRGAEWLSWRWHAVKRRVSRKR